MKVSHHNWSLPELVLDTIVHHLDTRKDVIAFSAVQRSWHLAAIRKLYDRLVVDVPQPIFEHRRAFLGRLENIMRIHKRGNYVDELVLKMKILQDEEAFVKPMVESSSSSTTTTKSSSRPTSPKGLVQMIRLLRKNSNASEDDPPPTSSQAPAPTPSMDIALTLFSIINQCRYLRKITLDFGKERYRMSLNADYLFRLMLQSGTGASTIKYLTITDLPKLYLPHNPITDWISSLYKLETFEASKIPSNFFTPDFQRKMARTAPPILCMTLKDITLWDTEADLVPNLWIPPSLESLTLENCSELTTSTPILSTVSLSCYHLRELYLPVKKNKLALVSRRSSGRGGAPPHGAPRRSPLEHGICQIVQHCPSLRVLDLAGNSGISNSVLLSICTMGENLVQVRMDDFRNFTGRDLQWSNSYHVDDISTPFSSAIEPQALATVTDFRPKAEVWA
ncbi:hypothetical protein INT43_007066 [Umbelopsis isabellina]|uniref:F-box domain-containing protein n=1 Tax=Mortierella isabellina TaxID=91625 RepID=A0A8H7UKE7_MORIS|nr:hypothetical protein INT43_007066 [Umbelopsis isabellina]